MTVFIVVSIIVLVGVAVAATLGRFGHTDQQMRPPTSSAGGWGTDDTTPLRVSDLGDIRFDTAVRGYRMDQVDAMIARLQAGHAIDARAAGDMHEAESVDGAGEGSAGGEVADLHSASPRVHPLPRKFSQQDPDRA